MVLGKASKSYELLDKIGEGSFGDVYLAREPKREQPIALKFLRFDSGSARFRDAVALFKREFELLRELKHPHLASVYDFGFDEERNQYFFSAEFCAGKNLFEAYQGQSVKFFEDALVQILSALDYIHSQGVIHSDIKPENVMVQVRDGIPSTKLLDFGVAGRLRSGQQGVGGSPAYMAPELLGPNPKMDARSDLYSLGVLALEMLTGQLPFARDNARAASDWQLRGSVPESLWQGKDVPPYLRELTEKLLKKNPSERFSNARVVLNFLNLGTSGRYQNAEAGLRAELPLEGPLVERRDEVLDGMQKRIQNFFAGGGSSGPDVHFVCGERGIGKTRLLEEIRQFLAVQEIRSHWLAGDWEIPSWARLSEALGIPAIGNDNLDKDWQTRRRIDALREAAKTKPLCLLIDDFHKVDRDLRDAILKLFETARAGGTEEAAPLFIIAGTEEDLEGGIALKRLSSQGVLQYIQCLLGKEERTEGLADLLFRYSGGLPLLVSEGLRYMAPGFLKGEALEDLLPSPQITSLYQDKLDALTPEETECLQLTALLFRPVVEGELLQILGASASALGGLMKNPVRMGLISSRSSPLEEHDFASVYQVNSQALAASLIDGLDPERRQSLHHKIAAGLKKSGQAPLEELAYHEAKAGLAEDAAKSYEEAANALKAQGQISSAARCFAKAIQLLPEGSEHWREIVTELSRLFIISGSYAEADESLRKLQEHPSWKDEELRGWLAFKKREFAIARDHYHRALQGAPGEPATQRILLENALGNIDLQDGKPGEAALRFQQSLEEERALPPEEQAKINNNNLGIALVMKGDEAGALEFYADRERRVEGRLKPDEEIVLLNGKSYVCLQAGRYEESISCLKRAMQLAEQSGALHPLSSIMGNLITALIKESRYAESLPLLQKIVSFQARLGNRRDVAYNLLRQGSVYLTLGMGEKAKFCFQNGKSISQHSDKNLALWYYLVEGYWEREHGSPERAWELFRILESESGAQGLGEIQAWAVYAQADLAYEQKNYPDSRRLLASIQTSIQDKEFLARLHLLEAKLSASEKGEDAEKLFADVENECLQGHYREILWELYHDWALTREKRQGPKAAQPLFQQGVQVVEMIVGSLPEEYRDRYLNQRQRKKLFDDWHHSQAPAMGGGMASRIKGFFKLGRASH